MPVKGTISVDENLCKACELCVEACPQHVIALDHGQHHPARFPPRPSVHRMAAPAAASARSSARKRPSPSTAKKHAAKRIGGITWQENYGKATRPFG